MNITAKELSGEHIGKTVSVNLGEQDIERKLIGIEHFEGSTMIYLQDQRGTESGHNMDNQTPITIQEGQ